MADTLSGVTVLVTRPAHQAEGFCQLVSEAGGRAIRFPVIEIQPIPLQSGTADVLQSTVDCLVFISANAVRIGLQYMQDCCPGCLQQRRVMAIGKATARELQDHDIKADLVPPSPYNSEALLAMPEMRDVRGRSFTLIKGRGGRRFLAEQLEARGASVNEVDVYVRVKPRQSNQVLVDLTAAEKPVVAITSVKGLHYLFEMASREQGEWMRQHARFLVPGDRVADAIRDLHIRQSPVVAENATDIVMISTLMQEY